jgi:hypothetical protein
MIHMPTKGAIPPLPEVAISSCNVWQKMSENVRYDGGLTIQTRTSNVMSHAYNDCCKWAQEEQCVPRQIAQPSVDLCLMIREYGSCGENEWLICKCNNSSGVILLNSESIKQYIILYQ